MKTFPMFLKMAGRKVIVAGGGEQAAQKARLILKTEAELVLLAPELDEELSDLVSKGLARHDPTPPTAGSFSGVALVFVATGCVAVDACMHALAKAAGAVVNVVDQPALCDAVTPSIVDRDPVVVAIGTEGNAPVLARLLKTDIERMMEPGLGEFARLAGRLRDSVARHVPHDRRRHFWRWMFAGAPRGLFSRGADRKAAALLKTAIHSGGAPDTRDRGAISVIGAGPGEADLMTLRAVHRLQEADVIVVGDGVDRDVLELARRDAERMYLAADDRAAPHPGTGDHRHLLALARQGKSVVRLVSGVCDGASFMALETAADAARVAFEIVPGVVSHGTTGLARTGS
ncbi:uroporphyrin-III C-methyltransferase/precorrin-2 dehydrogenase/sirohydrochlorin ferrochelatase [Aliiruegeria haliotis]|uniref:precorrin-2 dehydrogenase n=1 Tax=Aliiruegeria haliotis TaxID=1280846 RepID=A0A2T0RJR3_9RHOB|nr:NAD(P)-dependent oxidoreductase [Aliiruegeria haliotis]PRY21413.1 uroporphyrin-III C-methyltransferase/precorrin-2 dehydrogenase/sirohydrochlorin ferrochelatase [Aliiruegeria haliotis]